MSEKLSHHSPEQHDTEISPADRFRVNPEDYPIFNRQTSLDEHWGNNTSHRWNIGKTLSRFVTETASLIANLDGTSTESADGLPTPDHVIYLDKSARPVSWLVNIFWDDFSTAKRPAHSYLNIDRQPWLRRSGTVIDAGGYTTAPDGQKYRPTFADFHPENISDQDIARIRALYLPNGIPNEDADQVMRTPSSLDGKNIMIIDEVQDSGATLKIAKHLLQRAFPEAASINGSYFWHGGQKSHNGEHQMLSVPIWYNRNITAGRGAGELDPQFFAERHEKYQTNRTRAQKFGAIALSAFVDLSQEPGNLSRELMREMKQMHTDYQAGKIFLNVPRNYDPDRAIDLLENRGVRFAPASDPSPDTYVNLKHAIDYRPPSSY